MSFALWLAPEAFVPAFIALKTSANHIYLQETQRRVPASSRHDVLNATLSVRAREIKSVPICTVYSVAILDP